MIITEDTTLVAIRVIGHNTYVSKASADALPSRLVTFCIASIQDVRVYTIDIFSNVIAVSFFLSIQTNVHVNSLVVFPFSTATYVNYECFDALHDATKTNLVACTDDGMIVTWSIPDLLAKSEQHYRNIKGDRDAVLFVEEEADPDLQRSLRRPRRCSLNVHRLASLTVGVTSQRQWQGHAASPALQACSRAGVSSLCRMMGSSVSGIWRALASASVCFPI